LNERREIGGVMFQFQNHRRAGIFRNLGKIANYDEECLWCGVDPAPGVSGKKYCRVCCRGRKDPPVN